jgi:hypothetical protein
MEPENVSEMLHYSSVLTQLVGREDFIAFSRRENLKSSITLSLHKYNKTNAYQKIVTAYGFMHVPFSKLFDEFQYNSVIVVR